MGEIVKTTDHAARALARLTSQLKDKTKLQAFAATYLAEIQALEDALTQLIFDKRLSSPNCVGVILDGIGKLVGQPRNGVSDATYKKHIAARQRINRSNGLPEELYAVFTALGLTGMRLENTGTAGFVMHLDNQITSAVDAALFAGFLAEARDAGVNGQLHYQTQTDALTFTLPSMLGHLTVAAVPGAVTLTLDSTALLPTRSADVIVGIYMYAAISSNVLDTIAWTGKTATTLTGVTGVTNNHGIGSAVQINDPEKGLLTGGPIGGALAAVKQA